MQERIQSIFSSITERYENPIKIGSRCESNVYYRVEDIKLQDLETLSKFLAERVISSCENAGLPEYIIKLPNNRRGLADLLAKELSVEEEVEVIPYFKVVQGNGTSLKLNNSIAILVNDVITTAKSCLEAHTLITMRNVLVPCWASLIDRTLGPGPVPVIAALSGEPVNLIA